MPSKALPTLLCGLLCACAHTGDTAISATENASKATAMSQPQPPAGQITIHDYPELTPDEVGRRFLKLVDSLGTGRTPTLELVQAATQLPLKYRTVGVSGGTHHFTSFLHDTGWFFIFEFREDTLPEGRGVSYSFFNINDPSAVKMLDMAHVCGLDLAYYRSALLAMGFTEQAPLYDMFEEKRGRLLSYGFTRGGTTVRIVPQREGNAPDTKLYHECINRIGVISG
jgi:hypothetical protein